MKVLKGIVLLLVVANVGYFLYAHGIAPPPPSPQPERSGTSLKLVTTKSSFAATTPGAHAGAARCVSIGPFGELAESLHAQAPPSAADLHGDSGLALPLEATECPAPASATGDAGTAASVAR